MGSLGSPEHALSKGKEEADEFNAGRPPRFQIADIRAAIPNHCWVKDPWRSMKYVVRDVALVSIFMAVAAYLNSWIVWPVYWLAQGTMFWALFVLGHDCGHGSFSDNRRLNNLVGHFLHSFILIPYHGWRISHKRHHNNHGHVENDESWHPLPEKTYRALDSLSLKMRYGMPFAMFAFPVYLWRRSPGRVGSHFHPSSDLFLPHEKGDVMVSTFCWTTMLAFLLVSAWIAGPVPVLKLYGMPYVISVMWFAFVTYLQHHDPHEKLPWYRGKEWSYLRGALTTVDRDYGWLNKIHHNIGTHVIHHIFPQIPHYNLVEATKAAKPVIGKYYREPQKSRTYPFYLFGTLARSLRVDHFVSDVGDVVYYQSDTRLNGDEKPKYE